ncbi:MAG: acyl--CoA ligase, partial [Burkholderiales bacterium]|nr:acyl--CoA ligase [Burkholderiales bacterium]
MNPDVALTGTVPALLAARVRATPDAPAFCTESAGGAWQALSWREFAATVGSLRDALAAQGLRKGDRLALIAPVSLQWEQLHHAALSMGVVVVGLDAHDLPERLAAMAELAEVAAFAVADAKCLAAMAPRRLNEARFVLSLGPAGADWPPQARVLDWSGLLASDRTGSPPPDDPRPGD